MLSAPGVITSRLPSDGLGGVSVGAVFFPACPQIICEEILKFGKCSSRGKYKISTLYEKL